MPVLLQIALGGALGAMGRYGVNVFGARIFGVGFPFGTLLVNVIGCLLMGVLFVLFTLKADAKYAPLFMTGILGGFTTFSAFSLDAYTLFEKGRLAMAALYVGGSLGASLGAVVLGIIIAKGMLT